MLWSAVTRVCRLESLAGRKSDDGRQQLKALLQKVVDIDYIVTDTEQEALVLEANQIKSHRPRYNIHLKDDKKYPFIRHKHSLISFSDALT